MVNAVGAAPFCRARPEVTFCTIPRDFPKNTLQSDEPKLSHRGSFRLIQGFVMGKRSRTAASEPKLPHAYHWPVSHDEKPASVQIKIRIKIKNGLLRSRERLPAQRYLRSHRIFRKPFVQNRFFRSVDPQFRLGSKLAF